MMLGWEKQPQLSLGSIGTQVRLCMLSDDAKAIPLHNPLIDGLSFDDDDFGGGGYLGPC